MKIIALILFNCLLFRSSIAQQLDRQVFGSFGTTSTAGKIWLDYTAGETVVETYSGGSIVLNQGFHQAYERGFFNPHPKELMVYPNPTRGYIYIDIPDEMVNNCNYKLIDMAGMVISASEAESTLLVANNNFISIDNLPNAVYLLFIQSTSSAETFIFKIIKF